MFFDEFSTLLYDGVNLQFWPKWLSEGLELKKAWWDTIFIQIYMDPRGPRGVKKSEFFYNCWAFALRLSQNWVNFEKLSKLKKNH